MGKQLAVPVSRAAKFFILCDQRIASFVLRNGLSGSHSCVQKGAHSFYKGEGEVRKEREGGGEGKDPRNTDTWEAANGQLSTGRVFQMAAGQ